LSAETVQDAIAQIEARGLTLQSIGYLPVEPILPAMRPVMTDAGSAREVIEQTILRTHLAKVLQGGKVIVPALQAFSEEIPAGRRRNELLMLIGILERGDQTEAEQAFAALPEYWIPLLSAAISSSDPGRILPAFIRETQRSDELRRQWWLMFAYPFFIACIAGTLLVFLSVLVIPIFRDIFAGFNLNLPWLTSFNLTVASWIARAWPYVLLVFVLLVGGLTLRSFRVSKRGFDLSSPLFAFVGRTTAIARLSQFMADFLEAGLSVPDTLKVAGLLTNRQGLRNSVWRLADELQVNASAAKQLQPPPKMASVYYALRSEISTQARVRLLREITQANAEQVRLRLSWTRGVIEPVGIFMIGLLVGIVVLSLYLPLVKLIEGLAS
jgi:type IV pilus assembly protein PilC